jgi:hypothetical protein
LDVDTGQDGSGLNIHLWDDLDNTAQRWFIYEVNGHYVFKPACTTNAVMDIYDASDVDDTNIQTWTYHGGEAQQFDVEKIEPKEYLIDWGDGFTAKITNVNSLKSLALQDDSNVVIYTENTDDSQKWVFEKQSDGSYMIKDKNSGLYLDVYGCLVENGTNVQLWEQNDSGAQNFFIYESNGGYLLRNLRSSLVVDMDSETKEVHIYPESNSEISVSAQVFEIVNGDIETEVDTLTIKNSSSFAKEESFVVNVPSQTTAEQIIAQFENSSVAVYDADGNQVTNNSLCGTGYTVNLISKGEIIDSLTIVVRGDIDGNAKTDSTDYIRVKSAFLGTFELSEAQHKAGDVEKDGRIDSTDYIQIKSAFLGKFDLYA